MNRNKKQCITFALLFTACSTAAGCGWNTQNFRPHTERPVSLEEHTVNPNKHTVDLNKSTHNIDENTIDYQKNKVILDETGIS